MTTSRTWFARGCGEDFDWEIIFVDDNSPDGTAKAVRDLARTDRRVRLISRRNKRGPSSAAVEGAPRLCESYNELQVTRFYLV